MLKFWQNWIKQLIYQNSTIHLHKGLQISLKNMETYKELLTIKSYHTNQYGKASIAALLNILIEAAWAHAQVMDWGYDSLKSNNLFWVLSRIYVQFDQYPEWQDKIELSTWSAGTDGVYAYREYLIENGKGDIILRASTAWLILDLETRKIFRLTEYRTTFPRRTVSNACRNPRRIKSITGLANLNYCPVLFSELDINKHFNSVKYVERVLDDYGVEFLNSNEVAELEVNYLKEGVVGDRIAVSQVQLSDFETQNSLIRESDGADLCVLKITWRARK
jgi:acyl-ACP thioesterase